jgi:nicotinamidase-related amidase
MKLNAPLILIDYQEKLFPHIHNQQSILKNVVFLARAFKILNLPIIYTEQNPEGLGSTVEEVAREVRGYAFYHSKKSFSCACSLADGGEIIQKIRDITAALNTKQVVVCGIETHICVFQTVYDLLKEGYEVFLVQNASGSIKREDHETAVQTMRALGALVLNSTSIVYACLETASHPQFKEILREVKELLKE